MTLQLSDKDKKLLLVLGIILILALPYVFVVQPFLDKTETAQAAITTLSSRYEYLLGLNSNKNTYLKKTEIYRNESQEMLDSFPAGIEQEATLMFIHNMEKLNSVRLHQVGFKENTVAPMQQSSAAQETAQPNTEAQPNAGAQPNTEAQPDNTADIGITPDGTIPIYMVSSTSVQFAYEISYSDFADFLNYIEQYSDRVVISDFTAQYSWDYDIVSGTFVLNQYAIMGEGRSMPDPGIPEVNHVSGNIFSFKEADSGTAAENDAPEYDYFLSLSQPEADLDAKIIGKSNDASGATYLKSDQNKVETAVITFLEEDGKYFVNYILGSSKYPEENFENGEEFNPGDSIYFHLISSPRVGEEDQVGLEVSFVNKTEKMLHVTTTNEDSENPRIVIKGKTGNVAVD